MKRVITPVSCANDGIIDNTDLAVLHGAGKPAVMVPEIIALAEQ